MVCSQRLDPGVAVTDKSVDIVPPHACGSQRAARGYRVSDLATRAAMGVIIADSRAVNPPGISPSQVQINEGSRLVEVREVLAPALFIPRHYIGNRWDRKQASLADFGEVPFKILLPLTMLKDHVESGHVQIYFSQLIFPKQFL